MNTQKCGVVPQRFSHRVTSVCVKACVAQVEMCQSSVGFEELGDSLGCSRPVSRSERIP